MRQIKGHSINLVLPPATHGMLQLLMLRVGASTEVEVIRRALALLDKVSEEMEKGNEFFAHSPDGTERPLLFTQPEKH